MLAGSGEKPETAPPASGSTRSLGALGAAGAAACSASAGGHLIGNTGSTVFFQVALTTPAIEAYQAKKAVTMPR
jgi:hypothetical protein